MCMRHAGKPVIVFPASVEIKMNMINFGMIEAYLSFFIERDIKFYTPALFEILMNLV